MNTLHRTAPCPEAQSPDVRTPVTRRSALSAESTNRDSASGRSLAREELRTERPDKAHKRRNLARLRQWLRAHTWIVAASNVASAALFIAGCVGFYSPGFYTVSVTGFLCGSVLFLLSALGSAILDHGPST